MAKDLNEGNAWQKLVDGILNLPVWAQLLINTGMQAVQYITDQKHQPWFRHAVIPLPPAVPGPNKPRLDPNYPGDRIPTVMVSSKKTNPLQIARDVINTLLIEWMKPNLGGIVINANTEKVSRQIENSENMIIVQSKKESGAETARKQYTSDNSAPHPRIWNIEGYLSQSIPYLDEYFVLKPTLIAQQYMLDAYAQSRRPIIYRSGLCPWPTHVLIDDYSIDRKIEGMNAYGISLTLREWVTYNVPFYYHPNNTSGIDLATAGQQMMEPDMSPTDIPTGALDIPLIG